MCTSFSTASRATSSGVWNSGPTSRRSRDRRTPWRSPSGRGRGRPGPSWRRGCAGARPSSSRTLDEPCARARRLSVIADLPARRRRRSSCIGARWRPNTFSSAKRNLADRRLGARGVDREFEQVAAPPARACVSASSAASTAARVARALAAAQLVELQLRAPRRCRSSARRSRRRSRGWIRVDADDRLLAGIDARLRARGRFLDAQLRHALLRSPWPCRRGSRLPRYAPSALRARSCVSRSTIERAAPGIDDARRCRFPAAG